MEIIKSDESIKRMTDLFDENYHYKINIKGLINNSIDLPFDNKKLNQTHLLLSSHGKKYQFSLNKTLEDKNPVSIEFLFNEVNEFSLPKGIKSCYLWKDKPLIHCVSTMENYNPFNKEVSFKIESAKPFFEETDLLIISNAIIFDLDNFELIRILPSFKACEEKELYEHLGIKNIDIEK